MSIAIETIEEYTINSGRKQCCWICFNVNYNKALAFKERLGEFEGLFDREATDESARDEFLAFMRTNFPETKLTLIMDFAPPVFELWSYIGSFAIDCECDMNDEVFKALCEKYDDKEGKPKAKNAVLWTLDLDVAIKSHENRQKSMEDF